MLILAPISNMDLLKVIPLISIVIMGAHRSLFLMGREFVMIELTISLCDPFRVSMGCAYCFEKFEKRWDILDGIYQGNGDGYLFKGF